MPQSFSHMLKHHLLRTGLSESEMRKLLHDVPYRTWKRWMDRENVPPDWARNLIEQTLEELPDHSSIKTIEDLWEARRQKEQSASE